MDVNYDFDGTVALVTGASGALGGAVARAFHDAGASVAAADVVAPDDDDGFFDSEGVRFYEGDFTDEDEVARVVDAVTSDFGRLDYLANIAGTWRGGTPIDETEAGTFDFLFDVNLKTMFLASKHAIPHLEETHGAIVSVSARSSLEGGNGDGIYRASKAGVRLLTETIAKENLGVVRANAVMPSVIDTAMNREMMPDADFDAWVKPDEIASMVLFLCSDASSSTSGAAVPVYGEA
ncbi:SDR family oxidoreductase [Haloferax sp. MBLA0076]|uniref:SDR family oxidoreductase n=1 Tax=Haloferax litoreum TaxID=2666140 RepID=A0A6A8GHW7_9EURY|nr:MULTISPECIES: SDR family oxidoreductase [Haloferax]KAB1193557.1 SDR family oxidoreductase [Haloferax sp. CBA1148]MRX22072.1 SDR family oxidoreductase [Haloferax litoreum]